MHSLGGRFYKYFVCCKYLIPSELSGEGAFLCCTPRYAIISEAPIAATTIA